MDSDQPDLRTSVTAERVRVVVPHLPKGMGQDEVHVALREMLDTFVDEQGISAPLLWFYTPMGLKFAGHIEGSVTVYDCMDELSLFRGAPEDLANLEGELFRRADLVFTGGRSLFEAKRKRHPRVHEFPSSVDAAHFARARDGALPAPPEQVRLPRPRLGYFGVVDERIDRDLLAMLADANPAFSIVVVGPIVKIDPQDLPRRPNLHYLGPKRYEELPNHVGAWDVALLPFAECEATRFISPTKTLEYLAAGVPVVSTPIRDVVRPYGERGLVRIGRGEAFVRQVEAALADRGSPEARRRRHEADAFVARTSWDRTWEKMSELIEGVVRGQSVDFAAKEDVACLIA